MSSPYTGCGRGSCPPWSEAEDKVLSEFAALLQPWNMSEGMLPGRTVSACQTRWNNKLRLDDVNPRAVLNKDRRKTKKAQDFSADSAPIYGNPYIFRVPDGDPYLQRLIEIHGKDTINRNFAGATR